MTHAERLREMVKRDVDALLFCEEDWFALLAGADALDAQPTQPDDFRSHTCGECAWEKKGFCRRNAWGLVYPQVCLGNSGQWADYGYMSDAAQDDPACPAFVAKEAQP